MQSKEPNIEITELDKHFNTFYTNFNSTRVLSYPDMLVYKVGGFMAADSVKKANSLIQSLGLPLIAEVSITKGSVFADSFVVKINKTA